MWARLIKRVLVVGIVAFVAFLLVARWAIEQSKKVPEFYQHAIAQTPPEELEKSSRELEARVEQLHEEVQESGEWEAAFSAEQINAWLAAELPKRFPSLQAKGVQDPRVLISKECVSVAARFNNRHIDAVLSCDLTVRLTDQPNRIAVRVENLRAGALPLPLSQFQELIVKAAAKADVSLHWEDDEDGAVAIAQWADESSLEQAKHFTLEWIELEDSELIVAGRSGDAAFQSFEPRGPVYTLASLPESQTVGEASSAVTLSSRSVQEGEFGEDASAHRR